MVATVVTTKGMVDVGERRIQEDEGRFHGVKPPYYPLRELLKKLITEGVARVSAILLSRSSFIQTSQPTKGNINM